MHSRRKEGLHYLGIVCLDLAVSPLWGSQVNSGKMWTLVLGCLYVVIGQVTEATLTIGAFNIQRLSDNKVHDATVRKEIAQVAFYKEKEKKI